MRDVLQTPAIDRTVSTGLERVLALGGQLATGHSQENYMFDAVRLPALTPHGRS